MRGLTPMQAAFVREYVIDNNGAQAAIRAGYSRHTANVQACDLLTRPHIKTAVDEARARLQEKNDITVSQLIEGLKQIAFPSNSTDDTNSKNLAGIWPRDRIKALELLGKHLGMFVERREHSGPKGKPIEVNSRSWLEVMQEDEAGGD